MNVSKRGRETPNPRLTPANVQSVELKRRGVLTVDAAQKRAAVEAYAQNEATLRRTARRYSLCLDDAEDALQLALEILLCKAPSDDPHRLLKWMQTVVKREAMALRRERE